MKRVDTVLAILGFVIVGSFIPLVADEPPFVVVGKSPDFQNQFVGSPSIAILPSGQLVASHTWAGPGTTNNTTLIYGSQDRGETWSQISKIKGQFGSSLFVHNSALYLFGTSKALGSIVVRRSNDSGTTWTEPIDSSRGMLLAGNYVSAPVPVVIHSGRIWRSIEQPDQNRTLVMVASAPVDADLLESSNWTFSAPVAMNPTRFGRKSDRLTGGNLVAHPQAGLANMLSVLSPRGDLAAILPVSNDGERISYEPSIAFVDFPGGRSKFTVRYDPVSEKFWSVSNRQHKPFASKNILVLSSSNNLRDWVVQTILIRHVDSIWHGFHNADWQFDGDDLVVVCQTSWDGAKSSTRSNYLTFHRFENFRSLNRSNANPVYGRVRETKFTHDDFQLTGTQFTVEELKEDALAFARYQFKLKSLPNELDGWKFTRNVPGSRIQMKVEAKQDGVLFMMTADSDGGVIDVTGWNPVETTPLHYSDRAKTALVVFARSVKRGEIVEIPQGNWSGGMLLIPPEK